jgi:peptidoglycan/LPS O-acetylase OafA/YrhL
VEEHFYLLLAGLFWVLQRFDPRDPFKSLPVFFVLTVVGVPVLRALTFIFLPFSAKTHCFATHLRIDELFYGVFLSYLYHLAPRRLPTGTRGKLGMLTGATLLLYLCFDVLPSGGWRYVLEPSLVSIAFAFLLLIFVETQLPLSGLVSRFLGLFGFVGSHSYSIYLWHTAVLVFGLMGLQKLMREGAGYYLTFALYMSAAFVFGILMAKLVELPALQLRDRLVPSGAKRLQTATGKAPCMCDS